jgi:hypothetical protein
MNPISQSQQANPIHELAQAIYRLYSCDKQEERQSIMEAFRTLGKYFLLLSILLGSPAENVFTPFRDKSRNPHKKRDSGADRQYS